MTKAKSQLGGFTIVELLIVIVVIAILAAIVTVAYNGVIGRAGSSVAQANLNTATMRLEVDKVDLGTFPEALSQANGGAGLVADASSRMEYTSTGTDYCMTVGSIKDKKDYYQTNTTAATLGKCPGHLGYTAGTGTFSTGSIFGTSPPPGSYLVYNDGGGGLWTGDRFYTSNNNGIRVLGVRVWEPPLADSTFLSQSIDTAAYTNDWQGSVLPGWSGFGTAVAQTTYSGVRKAGSWTYVWFSTPFTIAKVSTSANGADMVALTVKYRGGANDGVYYVAANPAMDYDAHDSSVIPGTYLTELGNVGRSVSTAYPTISSWYYYGIDILFQKL